MQKISDLTPTKVSNTDSTTTTLLETPNIGIKSCDDYLTLITCLNTTNTTSSGNNYETLYNDFLSSRKDIPADQLELTCQNLSDNLASNPDILA
jgi:hypothetical protein